MKEKALSILIIGIFCLFPFMTGCISLEKDFPEKRFFILNASRNEEISSSDTEKILTVRRCRVSPRYESKGLVYRLKELNYESDYYNEFFISPASMFTEEIRKRLAGSGLLKHVVDPASLLDSTYILEGAVTALYGDYRVNTAPKAILEMQFFVLQQTAASQKIIFRSQYHEEEPLSGNTPDALVNSWNTAFNQILTEFETDLKEYISKIDH